MSIWTELFGGGGGGGDSGLGEFLKRQRKLFRDLELEGEEAEEFARELTSYRRGVLADRKGFAGTVNVGSAVRDSDARLAKRMEMLAEDDPTRVQYEESLAAERISREKSLRTISGEEFKVRGRISDLVTEIEEETDLDKLSELDKKLADLKAESGGRYTEREDLGEAFETAKKRRAKLDLNKQRAAAAARRREREQDNP